MHFCITGIFCLKESNYVKKSYLPVGFTYWVKSVPLGLSNFKFCFYWGGGKGAFANFPYAESLNPQTDQAANIPPNKSDDLLIASLPAELDIPTDPLAAPVPTADAKTDIIQPPPKSGLQCWYHAPG